MAGEKEARNDSGVKKEKEKKSVVGIIVNVFIAIVLVLVFTITINIIISTVSGKGYNSMFGTAMLAVKSDSMSTKSGYTPKEGKPEGFDVGDLIFVEEVNDNMTFEEGDIITFYAMSSAGTREIVTHRITAVGQDVVNKKPAFKTKGDSVKTNVKDEDGNYIYDINLVPDNDELSFMSYELVIGKYTGVKWGGIGHVGLFLETPVGYWLVIGVPALLILLYCIIAFVLAVTKRNKVDAVSEKERIRAQILAELRAEQGVPAPAQNIAAAQPAAPPIVEAEHDDDGIPHVNEDDMEASISRIKEELAANFGDPDEAGEQSDEEPAPQPEKKPEVKKTTATAAKKTGTTAAKKTTTSTAKKTGTTSGAKKATTSGTKSAAAAKKPATTKKTTSKSGLIGTSKTTGKKKTDE